MTNYEFIDKTIFFPEQGILSIGDLHIGYEHSLRDSGIQVPETQLKNTIKSLNKIISEIKKRKYKLKKVVFLGDIKHYFGYEWRERFYFNKVLDFLRNHVKDKDIILIKGNHDKFDFSGKKMKNYYFNKGLMFFHGHKEFPQVYEQRVKTIIMGHLHPSILLSDKQNIKREKYKCFLIGNYKRKEVIILPSFIGIIEGSAVNSQEYNRKDFSIIPHKNILKFNVFVVGKDKKVLNFGKVKRL
jgi:putative SbcD/Mre11-related phosphoesterase|tara:strand:- start:9685 stop:10410 length:726 start_codon:yes stop_codon:yes gene_type:complete